MTDFTPQDWSSAPSNLTLNRGEVHVWRANIDNLPHLAQLANTLTDDEHARANRFRFPLHRDRYIAARGQLRALLSRYLKSPAEAFRFTQGKFGKPALLDGGDLRFNVSHSHQLALYAFTLECELGVDVEYVRSDFGTLDIAKHYFSEHEQATLRALPPEQHTDAFFLAWTRKEAYIKAIGEGLSMPLAQFDVSLTPGQPARLLANRRTPGEVERWSMFELHPGEGYKGALMVEGQDNHVLCWQL